MNQEEEVQISSSSSSSSLLSDDFPKSPKLQRESDANDQPSDEVKNTLNDGVEEIKDSDGREVNVDSVTEATDGESNVDTNSGVNKVAPDNLNYSDTDRGEENTEPMMECSHEHEVDENNRKVIADTPDEESEINESAANDENANDAESNDQDEPEAEDAASEDEDEEEDIDDVRQELSKMQFQLIEQKKFNFKLIYEIDILAETLMEKHEELEMVKCELSKNSIELKKNLELLKENHSRLESVTRTSKISESFVKFMNLNIPAVMDRIKKKQPIATLQDLLSVVKFKFCIPEAPSETEKTEIPVCSSSEDKSNVDSTQSSTQETPPVRNEIKINISSSCDFCVNESESTEPSNIHTNDEIVKSDPEWKPTEEANKTKPPFISETQIEPTTSFTSKPSTSHLNEETEFYSAEESEDPSSGSTELIFSGFGSKEKISRSSSISSVYSPTPSSCNTSEASSSGSNCSSPKKDNLRKKKKKKQQIQKLNTIADQPESKSSTLEEMCTLEIPIPKRNRSLSTIVPSNTQLQENIQASSSPSSITKCTDPEEKLKGPKRDGKTGGRKNHKNQKRNKK